VISCAIAAHLAALGVEAVAGHVRLQKLEEFAVVELAVLELRLQPHRLRTPDRLAIALVLLARTLALGRHRDSAPRSAAAEFE
jgi:hypothetical protein